MTLKLSMKFVDLPLMKGPRFLLFFFFLILSFQSSADDLNIVEIKSAPFTAKRPAGYLVREKEAAMFRQGGWTWKDSLKQRWDSLGRPAGETRMRESFKQLVELLRSLNCEIASAPWSFSKNGGLLKSLDLNKFMSTPDVVTSIFSEADPIFANFFHDEDPEKWTFSIHVWAKCPDGIHFDQKSLVGWKKVSQIKFVKTENENQKNPAITNEINKAAADPFNGAGDTNTSPIAHPAK